MNMSNRVSGSQPRPRRFIHVWYAPENDWKPKFRIQQTQAGLRTRKMSSIGSAQSKKMLVGTWKLVSASNVTDKGIVNNEPYGRNFTGLLTYTSDGRMMALVTWGARKPLSNSRWNLAPPGERAAAFATS